MTDSQEKALAKLVSDLSGIPQRMGPAKSKTDAGTPFKVCGIGYEGPTNSTHDHLCGESVKQCIEEIVANFGDDAEIVWRRKPIWMSTEHRTTLSCRLAVERQRVDT